MNNNVQMNDDEGEASSSMKYQQTLVWTSLRNLLAIYWNNTFFKCIGQYREELAKQASVIATEVQTQNEISSNDGNNVVSKKTMADAYSTKPDPVNKSAKLRWKDKIIGQCMSAS